MYYDFYLGISKKYEILFTFYIVQNFVFSLNKYYLFIYAYPRIYVRWRIKEIFINDGISRSYNLLYTRNGAAKCCGYRRRRLHCRCQMHFSRCAAGGGVKSISRSRLDKKRICMPAICNPSAGCRKIDGTSSRIYRS